jgi:hypothetical protein
MFKILTDKEIDHEWPVESPLRIRAIMSDRDAENLEIILLACARKIAQSQLKADLEAMIEWGELQCPHATIEYPKRYCAICWAELKKELEGIK